MVIDWNEAERIIRPVPNYEELIKRLLGVMSYDFVMETYNHSMGEAKKYATRLLGSDPRGRYGGYLEKIIKFLEDLSNLKVKNCFELVNLVKSRDEIEAFCSSTNLGLGELIGILKYLLFWVLPTKMYLRELIDKENPTHLEHIDKLRKHKIRFTLDALEKGRTIDERRKIAEETGIPRDFITEIVNRADFTRMPYVSGKTIRHYFSSGYKSLENLAKAELSQLTEDVAKYLDSTGMKLSRSFIELDSGIAIANVLPKIVEQ